MIEHLGWDLQWFWILLLLRRVAPWPASTLLWPAVRPAKDCCTLWLALGHSDTQIEWEFALLLSTLLRSRMLTFAASFHALGCPVMQTAPVGGPLLGVTV